MTSEEPMIADSTNQAHFIQPITNNRSKLKGGDPSQNPIHGSDLIEHAFLSN